MKLIILALIIYTCNIVAQDIKPLSVWGYILFGASGANYSRADVGLTAQIGLGFQHKTWRLKIDRRVNKELTLFETQEKVNSSSILVGYSNQINKNNSIVYFNGNMGLGLVESTTRGKIINSEFLNIDHEIITKRGLGLSIDGGLEYRFNNYWGFTIGIFSNINNIRSFYGINSGFILGYL